MTTEEPDLTGLVLDGRYALVRRLGVGGMGSVYEARHVRIAKSVAVKVLNREFAYKESFRRRFLREAQAASLIRHKNVVAIHDFGDHEDVAYIVMELLEGRDLHVLVHERAPLPWPEARSILVQAAAALGAAHDRGVIHRDVKPANVFVADDPHDGMVVKVLDFGIARASTIGDPDPDGQAATGSSRVFGTPTYMAPEIAFGEPADGRSDIYSLGVVAYRVLTGHLPFDGDVPYVVISKHANDPPTPLRELEPTIPAGVEQVVLKALAKRPGDRFQSMGTFARALAAIDESGRGEVPASLLLETETTAKAGPRTEPLARPSRGTTRSRPPVEPGREGEAHDRDDAPTDRDRAVPGGVGEPRRAGASESSDVGTPVTDLGTERLPSRRRITGVSDVVDAGRTGFTERVDEPSGPLPRPASSELELGAKPPTRPSGQVTQEPTPAPTPPPRPWNGLVRVLGLLALVTVAAAVGAIVARTQPETVAPTPGPTPGMVATREGDAVGAANVPRDRESVPRDREDVPRDREDVPREPAAMTPSTAAVAASPAEPAPSPVGGSGGGSSGGSAGASGGDVAADDASAGAPPPRAPTPAPRPSSRRPTDASVKKKLTREIQRACRAGAAGYRATIEGIITADGRVTGARVLDAPGDARRCIERLVDAQRFPPGELRTLDLSVAL